MSGNYKVFKKGTHKMKIYKNRKDMQIALLSKEDSVKDLEWGIFRMKNGCSINATYSEEVIHTILKGKLSVKIGKEVINLEKGDIFNAREGLDAILYTESDVVETFFISYAHRK